MINPLDYNALLDINAMSGNRTALELANQINDTMTAKYGSLYSFWNEVFVLFGKYPSAKSWNVSAGVNQAFSELGPYHILSTVSPESNNTGVELQQYVDVAMYYAIWNAKVAGIARSGGNLTAANSIFSSTQESCTNYGCMDSSNIGQTSAYQSFKVALDLIAYNVLLESGAFASATASEMVQVNSTINRLVYVANELQAPNGGVYTQYNVDHGCIAPIGPGVQIAENGETTSLFAIAYYLWNDSS